MIRWQVRKRLKRNKIAVTNLMDFHHWSKALKYVQINSQKNNPNIELALTYEEEIKNRLNVLDDVTVMNITRG